MKGLRLFRLLFLVLVTVATLLTVAVVLLATLDLSPYRGPLEARLSNALARQVRLGGPIRVQPSLWPTVTVQDVTIANPRWARDAHMVEAERLSAQFDLLALLEGRFEIARVALSGATVHLESRAAGPGNWMLEEPGAPAPQMPTPAPPRVPAVNLPRIEVRNSEVDYRDRETGVVTRLTIDTAELIARADEPLELAFVGTLRGRELSMALAGGFPEDLLRREAPWPVRVAVRLDDAELTAGGELRWLPQPRFDLRVHARGGDFRQLGALAGLQLPPLGPFELDARLVKDAYGYRVADVSGFLGPEGSDLHFRVRDGRLDAPVKADTELVVEGTFRSLPFRLEVHGAPYPRMLREGGAGPMRASVRIARTTLDADGTVMPTAQGFDLRVEAKGADVSSLEPLVGRELPSLGPYRVSGRLTRTEDGLALDGFETRVARSDARGSLRVRFNGGPPAVSGNLTADTIHLDDFRQALAGAAGAMGTGGAAGTPLTGRLLPAGLLRALDLSLEARVGRVRGAGERIEALRFTARLQGGDLAVEPLHVRLAGAPLDGSLVFRTGGTEPRVRLEARGRDIAYGPVLAALRITDRLSGRASALDFSLQGQGRTLEAIWRDAALRLAARRGTVIYTSPATGGAVRVEVDEGQATTGGGEGLRLTARGRYRDAPYTVRLGAGGLPALWDDTEPWPLTASGMFAGASLGAEGAVRELFEGRGMDLRVRAEGPRLDALVPLLHTRLPALGPFRFTARVRDSLNGVRLTELQARVGESDVSGRLRYVARAGPGRFVGELTSGRLRLADLEPNAGAPPPGAAAEDGAQPVAADGRVIPRLPLPVALLREVELDLAFQGTRVELDPTVWHDLTLKARLRDGRLHVDSFAGRVWNGDLQGSLTLDASRSPPAAKLAVTVQGLEYTQVFRSLGTVGIREGTADFALRLQGRGGDLRAVLGGAEGAVEFLGGSGRIENQLLDLWASDLLLAMVPRFGEKKATELRCAVGHFDVVDGKATTKSLVLDVERVVIRGAGTLNLASEALDFLLWPEPRDASLVSVSTPMRLTGTLGEPSLAPQTRGVLEEVAWLLFSAQNPLALLVGLVRPSAVEDNPCITAMGGGDGNGGPQEHDPPNILNKTGDFFRGLGNMITRPFQDREP